VNKQVITVRPTTDVKAKDNQTDQEIQEFKAWVNNRNALWGLIPRIRKENEKDGMQQWEQDSRGVFAGVVRHEPDGVGPQRPEGSEAPSRPSEPETDALLFPLLTLPCLPEERVGEVDVGVPETWEAQLEV
jgi:hypothetical protein